MNKNMSLSVYNGLSENEYEAKNSSKSNSALDILRKKHEEKKKMLSPSKDPNELSTSNIYNIFSKYNVSTNDQIKALREGKYGGGKLTDDEKALLGKVINDEGKVLDNKILNDAQELRQLETDIWRFKGSPSSSQNIQQTQQPSIRQQAITKTKTLPNFGGSTPTVEELQKSLPSSSKKLSTPQATKSPDIQSSNTTPPISSPNVKNANPISNTNGLINNASTSTAPQPIVDNKKKKTKLLNQP